jgi:hypothetical protein
VNSVVGLWVFAGLVTILVIALVVCLIILSRSKSLHELSKDIGKLQTALEQAAQADTLNKAANHVLSRLVPGVPPPYAPRIDLIDDPNAKHDVAIHGRNFSANCVVWFGSDCAHPEPNSTANLLHVRVPAGQSGKVDVCVQSPSGLVSAPYAFGIPKAVAGPAEDYTV